MAMKLKDMKVGVRYVVTKGGLTLFVGEHVCLRKDGCLESEEAMGWLIPDEWSKLRNEIKLDVEYYHKKKARLQEEIKGVDALLCEYSVKG